MTFCLIDWNQTYKKIVLIELKSHSRLTDDDEGAISQDFGALHVVILISHDYLYVTLILYEMYAYHILFLCPYLGFMSCDHLFSHLAYHYHPHGVCFDVCSSHRNVNVIFSCYVSLSTRLISLILMVAICLHLHEERRIS